MKQRKLMILGLMILVTSQFFGCGFSGDSSLTDTESSSPLASAAALKDPITGEPYPAQINIGIIEGGPESAILMQQNYFREIGVEVNAVTYSAGTAINNAVISKDVDVASFGSSPVALGLANGINYKVIFVPYVQGGNIEALVVKNGSGINTIPDLKGKTVASPFGTTSHYALLNALQLSGLNANDVTLLDIGGQDMAAAWTRGDIEAAYIWSPALDECLKDGRILINDGQLAQQGILIPEIAVARTEFAEKYPTLVSQYIHTLIKVYELIQTDPSQAIQNVADWEGVTKENATGLIEDNLWVSGENQLTDSYLGTTAVKGQLAETLKTIASFHEAQGNISKAPDRQTFEEAIDPSFVELSLSSEGTN